MISDYLWRHRLRQQYPNSATRFFVSFDSFLKAIPKDINTHWSDHIRGADKACANFLIHIRPQYQYISDSKGDCMVDDILKFEHLQVDMAQLLKRYGLHTDKFKSPQLRSIKDYYNRWRLDLVNEIFEKDFSYYEGMQ